MAKSKKYTTRVIQGKTGWTVEILRRMTSKKQVVTKSKDGFASENEAQAWADVELAAFLERLSEQSKQRSDEHAEDLKYDQL